MSSVAITPRTEDQQLRDDSAVPTESEIELSKRAAKQAERKATLIVRLWQVGIVVVFLLAWQFLPQVPGISTRITFLDPFFISSPTQIFQMLIVLISGSNEALQLWAPLGATLSGALVGTITAVIVAIILGLLVSNNEYLHRVLNPFIVALNAVPRIALIPVIVLVVANSALAVSITAFSVVFFLVFFNAVEGGSSVRTEMIQNVRLLGGTGATVIWRVRLRYVLAWSFASIPNAIAFGIIGAVTAELFTGSVGIGSLLRYAVETANATLTFAVVVVLTVASLVLILTSEALVRPLLRWWHEQ